MISTVDDWELHSGSSLHVDALDVWLAAVLSLSISTISVRISYVVKYSHFKEIIVHALTLIKHYSKYMYPVYFHN